MTKKICIIISLISLLFTIPACGVSSSSNEKLSLAIVYGNRSNSKSIPIGTSEFQSALSSVVTTFGTIGIIRLDGSPECVADIAIRKPKSGLSSNKIQQIAEQQISELTILLKNTKAEVEEADTLKAISLAARYLSNKPVGDQKVLIIADTGLSTTGLVNFTNNLLLGSPEEIVEQLASKNAIPNLSGVSVLWFSLGDVAFPQTELSPFQEKKLKEIWNAILEKSNAKNINFVGSLSTHPIETNLPYVSPVSLDSEPAIFFEDITTPIILSQENLSFIGDSARYVDTIKPLKILDPIANILKSNPTLQILLVGTTASGDPNYCSRLSKDRSEQVKKSLLTLGVSADQLITIGLGFTNPWHIDDITDGKLNENAASNRKVVIMDASTEEAKKLLRENR